MPELLSWHRPGVNVVCIKAARADCGITIDKGAVYTVREVLWPHPIGVGFRLVGVYPQPCSMLNPIELQAEPGWYAANFRPARETSIESLEALLSPSPAEKRRMFEEILEEAGLS